MQRKAFTPIEMLVVVAIIVGLMAMMAHVEWQIEQKRYK